MLIIPRRDVRKQGVQSGKTRTNDNISLASTVDFLSRRVQVCFSGRLPLLLLLGSRVGKKIYYFSPFTLQDWGERSHWKLSSFGAELLGGLYKNWSGIQNFLSSGFSSEYVRIDSVCASSPSHTYSRSLYVKQTKR